MPRTMTAETQTITRLVWYFICDIVKTDQESRKSFLGSCITVSCSRSMRSLIPVAGLTAGTSQDEP